jgi:pimeloyl-ACP methyl ester carboxylesterase
MKFIYAALAAALIFSAIIHCSAQGGPGSRKGSLYELAEKASANIVRRGTNGFRVPTPGQLKAWTFIAESILDGRVGDAVRMKEQLSFPYEIFEFTESTDGRTFIVVQENAPYQVGWGLFVFDPKSKNPLVLQAPHPLFDGRTEMESVDAFIRTGASAYLMAGAHRRANSEDTPCTQPHSADPEANYPVSDVAHAVATPFHAIHEAIARKRPKSVTVQLHGMTERDNCPNAFLSNGSRTVTSNSRRLLGCLLNNGVEAEIYDGNTKCPLNALSNVQGRFSNGETTDPCRKGVTESPEPGRFIHIEQAPILRRDRDSWKPVIESLRCAFPERPDDPANRGSFEFKDGDNPAVKVFWSGPKSVTEDTRVLFVIAGKGRNAEEYLESWVEWATQHDYLVLSPLYDDVNWPEGLGYNFGNIASGEDEFKSRPNPKPKWAFTVLENLFSEVRAKFKVKAKSYDIFGHSAGGQFVHRFLLFYPENHVRRAIAANPGFYTLPDLELPFPYGLKGSPVEIDKRDLKRWTARDVILMRGTEDTKRTDNLRQTPEADAQGKNRFERAGLMFEKIKAVNSKTKWTLTDVPNVGHNQKGMALAAQKYLGQ